MQVTSCSLLFVLGYGNQVVVDVIQVDDEFFSSIRLARMGHSREDSGLFDKDSDLLLCWDFIQGFATLPLHDHFVELRFRDDLGAVALSLLVF